MSSPTPNTKPSGSGKEKQEPAVEIELDVDVVTMKIGKVTSTFEDGVWTHGRLYQNQKLRFE